MKPAKLMWLFWLGSVVLLAGAGVFMWVSGNAASEDRKARNAALADAVPKQPRVQWKDDAPGATLDLADTRLSPIARPKEPEPPKPIIQPPPPTQKTDDQLRTELETELNRRFRLLRMMLSSSAEHPDTALVVADTARMLWFEGMNLKEDYASASGALRNLACDLTVVRIDAEGMLLDAASFERPEKRFEILMKVHTGTTSRKMKLAEFQVDGNALKLPLPEESARPASAPRELERAWFDKGEPWPMPRKR